ncbi:protein FAM98C [Periophthalmus magnuspinnatus]|uniref:protein FAM98C n=1 Tax=Periophthalmus magnuspinnatus TaxID=409849 RepID=UPI00145B62C6|nr:protein FAM98C [Periophthalmus magnuspinnatus]
MHRAIGTVSAIKSLGYPGPACVRRCECDELPCPLLTWLCAQLKMQCPELKGGGSDLLLAKELKNMLLEMSSPLTFEVSDPSTLDKITDYFISELQAAIINKHKDISSDEKGGEEDPKEQRCVSLNAEESCQENEDSAASKQAEWMLILKTLNMDANSCVTDVLNEVESRMTNLPSDAISPLLKTSPNPEQWVKLKKLNEVLSKDYKCRKQMMIKRFQVTLESFTWGDIKMEKSKVLDTIPQIALLEGPSDVSLHHVLAARVNLSCNEPIRPGNTTSVYKVKMGAVPDRGGRPGEIEPPMPSWEDRKSGHRSGRGGGNQKWRKFADKKKKKR